MASPGGTLGLDIFLLNVSNDNGFTEELDPRVPWRIGNTSYYDFGGIAESDLYDTVFYHCDGIVCMINWEKIVLWNPALLESKIIPPLNDIVDWTMVEATGFGYDPVANDYKILRIWKRDLIEIYSLNANTWKETAKGGEKNMLLSVDLHSGQSQIVPLPARKSSSRTLEVWNDSIAFISFYEKEGSGLIELWLSKNCLGCINDSSLWIKYQSIVNLEGIRAPLRILKGDELLLNGEEDDFFSYNLHTRRLRKLIIDEVGGIRFWGLSYVKSLVSVNRRGQA
ncbi:F-box associated interaction domain containing protein [Parasponia andersonii]|uniref:F-box associated interaction domain containing protein n=1 Tax=Parasponia andersonii TaxID=3476 RepID=A0A2P5DR86_PARAD|nr:F-box associated interaction domain containing protein [Parasponia andersonii]